MASYYDTTAENYTKSKELPRVLHIDVYTYFNLLGDLTGRSILDLGCGEGFYTRKLKRHGAASIVGIDLSSRMIEIAKQEETKESLGIKYIVANVMELGKIGCFDLVTASYLLNHAQTKEQLLKICQTIYVNLKPGGRFVSINDNVQQSPESFHICKKYGYMKSIKKPFHEGATITLTFFTKNSEVKLYNYYLSKTTYEWAFRSVGFKEIRWYKPIVSPEGIHKFGQEFWQDFLDYAPMIGIECLK